MLNRFSDRIAMAFILIYKQNVTPITRKPGYDLMIKDWYYSSEYSKGWNMLIRIRMTLIS